MHIFIAIILYTLTLLSGFATQTAAGTIKISDGVQGFLFTEIAEIPPLTSTNYVDLCGDYYLYRI